MKSIFVAAAALATLTAIPAVANSGAAAKSSGEKAAAAQSNPNKRFCFEDTTTGSRIAKRTCKTRAEWVAAGLDMSQFDR